MIGVPRYPMGMTSFLGHVKAICIVTIQRMERYQNTLALKRVTRLAAILMAVPAVKTAANSMVCELFILLVSRSEDILV